MRTIPTEKDDVLCFERSLKENTLRVFLNFGTKEVRLTSLGKGNDLYVFGGAIWEGDGVTLPAHSGAIVELVSQKSSRK